MPDSGVSSAGLAVSVRAITKSFDPRRPVMSNFSFNVPAGMTYAIMGPSGCGKSTLLRLLAGVDRPDHDPACVSVLGGRPDKALRFGKVALLSSESTLLPWRSVLDNIRLPLDLMGHRRTDANQRANDYLQRVRLTGLERRRPHELSDGQRQRVRLAQALVTNPVLLMLDEPFSAVDEGLRQSLINEISIYLSENEQRTAILITHNSLEAAMMADKIFIVSGPPLRVVDDRIVVDKFGQEQLTKWIIDSLVKMHKNCD